MLNLVSACSEDMKPYVYRGEDCTDMFCEILINIRAD